MSGLKDKVVIITGASGGIGGATAIEFARVGAKLCITGRSEEKLNGTKLKCVEAGLLEDNILTVIADVTKEDDILKIVTQTVEKFKQVDVLVNNAGHTKVTGFESTSSNVLDEMYNVNVKSVFSLCQVVLPHLIQSKGNIVNVSSMAGSRPLSYMFAYSTAKAAVNHMTEMMALELGPKGVRVNAVTPAVIKSSFFTAPGMAFSEAPEKLPQFYEAMASAHPMQRVGEPEEVAKTILFLASDSAPFISGALIAIDGARSCTTSGPNMKMAS